jgi:hypothetical protein
VKFVDAPNTVEAEAIKARKILALRAMVKDDDAKTGGLINYYTAENMPKTNWERRYF